MIYAAIDPTFVASLVTVILGGTGFAAVAAFRKAGPEAGAIATGSLITVNQELRTEILRLSGVVTEQRGEIETLGKQVRDQNFQIESAERRLRALRDEIDDLESHIGELKS